MENKPKDKKLKPSAAQGQKRSRAFEEMLRQLYRESKAIRKDPERLEKILRLRFGPE